MTSQRPHGRGAVRAAHALELLTAEERSTVLTKLLVDHPELSEETEHRAVALLSSPSVDEIAANLELALKGIPLENLGTRVGRVPGRGYVHETDAAWELVEEALQPFLTDLERRAGAGLDEAATSVATAIVAGLYRVREPEMGSVLAYAGEDAPIELATQVIATIERRCGSLAEGTGDEHWPRWSDLT
jgi:hypothetical protein